MDISGKSNVAPPQENSPTGTQNLNADPDLPIQLKVAQLQQKIQVLGSVMGNLTQKRQAEKPKNLKTYRIIAEPLLPHQPALSGNDIAKYAAMEMAKGLKLPGFKDFRTTRRAYFFTIPDSIEVTPTRTRLLGTVKISGKEHQYRFMILPVCTYRITVTGPGVQFQRRGDKLQNSEALQLLLNDAWASNSSYPSEECLSKKG